MSINMVQSGIDKMNTEFPRPDIELSISEECDLQEDWPEQYWPDNLSPGVYMFFDEDDSLLYVGKAVGPLGRRLSDYFNHAEDGSAEPTRALA